MTQRTIHGYLAAVDPLLLQPQYPISAEEMQIGRDADHCEIIVSSDYVSRVHCQLKVRDDGRLMLLDRNSSNGLFVNGQRVQEHVLEDEDAIGCGRAEPPHFLFTTHPPPNERTFILEDMPAYGIGRDAANALPLPADPTISDFHARVRKRGDTLLLEDLGSANGTFVNGDLVGSATILPTDTVRIGSTEMLFALQPMGICVRLREKRNQIRLNANQITRKYRGKTILRDINLVIEPGEFVGVLGPSGAGKSTLLNALNGFQPANSGDVLLNQTSLYKRYDMFRNAIGYVPQDDIIHKELTVYQSLLYTAKLRLPKDSTLPQLKQHVTSVIETLGLSHVKNNFVTQLSGGQRKRVSIGCELLTRPSLIFLDEPTSGLDPSTEEKLMNHFRRMAEQGQTVILTTHILYNLGLLNMIVLLARGRLVYFGPIAELCPYFSTEERPITRPIDIFDLLEPETTDSNTLEERAECYEKKYRQSSLYTTYVEKRQQRKTPSMLQNELAESIRDRGGKSSTAGTAVKRKIFGVLNFRQWAILMKRTFHLKFAFPTRLMIPLLTPLLMALLLSTISIGDQASVAEEREAYLAEHTPALGMLERSGLMAQDDYLAMRFEGLHNLAIPISVPLFMVMTAIFLGTLSACLEISGERPIYRRERAVNLSIPMYLASKLPVLFLLSALQCLIFVAVAMIFIYQPGVQIFQVYLVILLIAWVSCMIGLFISSLDPTSGQNSVVLAVIAVLPQLIFSGAMGPGFYREMGAVTKAIAALFPGRWGFEMILSAFYKEPEWMRQFITNADDGMGFRFGLEVYATNVLALGFLALAYFLVTCYVLKRDDQL